MSFVNKYKTDRAAETDGTWVILDEEDGIAVKVRRFNSPAARALRGELDVEFGKELKSKDADVVEKANEKLMTRMLAKAIIVDWSGISDEDADGNEVVVPFSSDTAEEILFKYPDFRNEILAIVFDRSTFRQQVREVAGKN